VRLKQQYEVPEGDGGMPFYGPRKKRK